MADLKDKQIRLVGSQNFAYATGSNYTQGHVHFTTDEHGSIVVNGKVYGTTDASYVYVGSENIPTYVANAIANALNGSYEYADNVLELSYAYTYAKINALDGKVLGTGNFISRVQQVDGNVTAYKDTLQTLVTVKTGDSVYAPKGTNENVKFIKSFEIEGDTIIPKWDYFANNIPGVTVTDNRTNDAYAPKFDTNNTDHTISIGDGTRLATYSEFNGLKEVVDRFFGGAELDTETVKSYIDTLSEIQEAFKNSYAEGIANSVNNIKFHGNNDNANSYQLWITYTTNGSSTTKQSAYVNIPYATDTAYGLAKYDDRSIKKNSNGQLYVNGELTDTKYSLDAAKYEDGAYIKLVGTDGTASTIQFKGTGIAEITYNSTNKVVEINVPETKVNYDHHSTANGVNKGNAVIIPSNGSNIDNGNANAYTFINSVNLSADGKLTYTYFKLQHATTAAGAGIAGPGSNKLSSGSIVVPKITFNECGHITAYENVTISGIAAENHSHDEFVWL